MGIMGEAKCFARFFAKVLLPQPLQPAMPRAPKRVATRPRGL